MRPEQSNPFTNARVAGDGVDSEVYHATQDGPRGSREFIMSRGELADFVDCPEKWRDGAASKETAATKFGSLMDTLVLSLERFEDRYAVFPDTYPCEPTSKDPRSSKPWNNSANFCKEWKKERDGKSFIYREKFTEEGAADEDTKTTTLRNAERARARLLREPELAEIIRCSRKQVMVRAEYHDKATGLIVPFKMLLDLVPDASHPDFGKTLADYKTARNASEGGFKHAMHDSFYDWQAIIYRDGYVAATGEDRTDFLFVVQENVPPYQPAFWSIGCDWMSDARAEVLEALRFYAWCVVKDKWPGYPISTPICSWGSLSREAWMLRNIERPPMAPPQQTETAPLHALELTP